MNGRRKTQRETRELKTRSAIMRAMHVKNRRTGSGAYRRRRRRSDVQVIKYSIRVVNRGAKKQIERGPIILDSVPGCRLASA
ncbi:MAG: hypothetical protein ACYS8W_07790 [Planctomycetota bacterium]|jgi:hypothetical protein